MNTVARGGIVVTINRHFPHIIILNPAIPSTQTTPTWHVTRVESKKLQYSTELYSSVCICRSSKMIDLGAFVHYSIFLIMHRMACDSEPRKYVLPSSMHMFYTGIVVYVIFINKMNCLTAFQSGNNSRCRVVFLSRATRSILWPNAFLISPNNGFDNLSRPFQMICTSPDENLLLQAKGLVTFGQIFPITQETFVLKQ